ncbi:MAG: 50S ribosomal protein L11 methyltransferase [Chthonomonas sp.]|nr:50S ribosomal protein L11 methyltransferase [Chthonomonas sp.]
MIESWTCVTATLRDEPEDWAPYHEVFARHGIDGTIVEEKPWRISGYCYDPADVELDALKTALAEAQVDGVQVALVPSVDWAEMWKQYFVPRRIGERFVVRPTWEAYETQPGDLEIVLDPGQAFGTGDHPTTRMCLELMERAALPGERVADIGCGSGILSVGAMLLGAQSCVGVDVERASVEASRENAERNGVECTFFEGMGFQPLGDDGPYDVVLSNIISAALITLAPHLPVWTTNGARWIMSGIIQANWPDVRAAAERHGFAYREHREEGEWVAALFDRV